MLLSKSTNCPEWCIGDHSPGELEEEDFFHSKTFGTYDDGTPGVVSVGISQFQGKFGDIEATVQEIIFSSADDLRTLARDCLEAAQWMDENLGVGISLVSHGK